MRALLFVAIVALVLAGGGAAVIAAQPRRKLYHLEDRGRGIDPQLEEFLRWWERNGRFAITVVDKGGVRTSEAEQRALFDAGMSGARTLAQTPHGPRVRLHEGPAAPGSPVRFIVGQAVDVAPYERGPNGWAPRFPQPGDSPAEVARIRALFTEIGEAAELFGLVWGGRWRTKTFPTGDLPHLETSDWLTLPLPPGGVA